jgi:CMP-2-keto-3-deoxyoctulosonic acid synthetase
MSLAFQNGNIFAQTLIGFFTANTQFDGAAIYRHFVVYGFKYSYQIDRIISRLRTHLALIIRLQQTNRFEIGDSIKIWVQNRSPLSICYRSIS